MAQNQDVNTLIAHYFYSYSFNGDPRSAITFFTGSTFEIDNPRMGTSKETFISYFEDMKNRYSSKTFSIERTIASKNLVSFQTRQSWPGGHEYLTMNFFKFNDDGLIMAYWDERSSINA